MGGGAIGMGPILSSKTSPRAWRSARFLLGAIKRVARDLALGQGSEQALSMELAMATVEADHIAAGVAGERFEHQAGAMQRRVPPARLCRPGAAGPVGSVGAWARRLGKRGPA